MSIKQLARFFENHPSITIGVRKGSIVFGNRAAARRFPKLSKGSDASYFFPAEVLTQTEAFTTEITLEDAYFTLSGAPIGETWVYTLVEVHPPSKEKTGLIFRTTRTLRQNLSYMRLALDEGMEKDAALDAMHHAYHGLMRDLAHLDEFRLHQEEPLKAKFEWVELNRFCTELVYAANSALYSTGKSIVFSKQEQDITCMADPELLERALLNLLSNALGATEKGSCQLEILQKSKYVLFVIRDKGDGFSAAEVALSLEIDSVQDYTDPNQGIGLGLWFARQIAKAHGGSIVHTANEPKGTVAWLCIPERHSTKDDAEMNTATLQTAKRLPVAHWVLQELASVLPASSYACLVSQDGEGKGGDE